ncbi:MAG TPA: response regulator [Candidatus Acidoferrales bacterium]|nr:response regulator [Candidatus Acidoferrales bacterium]
MREIVVQETGIAKKQKTLQRLAVVALGWTLMLGGIVGLLLPAVPGVVLLAVGAFLLNERYAWLRRAIDKCRSSFPALERALSKMERAKQLSVDDAQAICGTRKVLIFDEYIEDLARYAQPFEIQGVEVHKCASIESAMRCVEREEFDLALVDQVSPAFEGRRVIRHLVRYNWPMPFIVLAQFKDVDSFHQAVELGAVEYLEKPVSTAKMNEIIERFLANSLRYRDAEGSFHEIVSGKMR